MNYETLYNQPFFELAIQAQSLRTQLYGKKVYFNINRHINPTNICQDICKFCAYSANRKNPNPYTMSHDDILQTLHEATQRETITEAHIVSAHNPTLTYSWYFELIRHIKKEFPSLHIKAFTAAEINFLATHFSKTLDTVLDDMIEAGVDSMPGGGAEIFDETIRSYICKGKVDSQTWLEIHKKWHLKGKKSNATMLFGHVENRLHRIDHMLRLKAIQEETGGFNAFIPLVYQLHNNYLNVSYPLTGQEILRTIAISRIVLNSIPHIKAYWPTMSANLALVAQNFGANDIDGTIQKESIHAAAGAKSSEGLILNELVYQIKNSDFIPIERDSLYNEIKEW